MKKFIIAFLVLAGICGFAFGDAGGYYIQDYEFTGTFNEDNSVTVKERILVNFTSPRHGIYRTIPNLMYVPKTDSSKVSTYRNHIREIDVKNSRVFGQEMEFMHHSEYEITGTNDDYTMIKIGSANENLSGLYRYEISYVYAMGNDGDKKGDFIFYSVLGADWNVRIEHFHFSMDFVKPLPEETQLELFSGPLGAQGNVLNVEYSADKNSIHGFIKNVDSNNAVTIFARLPEGYFVKVKNSNSVVCWILFLICFLICGFTLFLAFTTKHDKPVKTVEFYPPEGVSSAEVGYIIDSSADDVDILSLIPYWADKGYIAVEDNSSYITLKKLKNLPEGSPRYMTDFFSTLFYMSDVFQMKNLNETFVNRLDKAKGYLHSEFKGERQLFERQGLPVLLLILSCLSLGALLAKISSFNINLSSFDLSASWIILLKFFIGITRFFRGFNIDITKRKSSLAEKIIYSGILALVFYHLWTHSYNYSIPFIAIFIDVVMTALVAMFCNRIVKETKYNVEMSGKLLGLKEFIRAAELPRLKVLFDENPSYFFNILPYAQVFGLTDKWIYKFRDINVIAPDWYTGRTVNGVYSPSLHRFSEMQSKISAPVAAERKAIAEAAAASSGGGSSGGHSGGGGGGGGGGSW